MKNWLTVYAPSANAPVLLNLSSAGFVGNAAALTALPQGDQRILLEPRGSRRLSSQSLLDVRVSKTIHVAPPDRLERGAGLEQELLQDHAGSRRTAATRRCGDAGLG